MYDCSHTVHVIRLWSSIHSALAPSLVLSEMAAGLGAPRGKWSHTAQQCPHVAEQATAGWSEGKSDAIDPAVFVEHWQQVRPQWGPRWLLRKWADSASVKVNTLSGQMGLFKNRSFCILSGLSCIAILWGRAVPVPEWFYCGISNVQNTQSIGEKIIQKGCQFWNNCTVHRSGKWRTKHTPVTEKDFQDATTAVNHAGSIDFITRRYFWRKRVSGTIKGCLI